MKQLHSIVMCVAMLMSATQASGVGDSVAGGSSQTATRIDTLIVNGKLDSAGIVCNDFFAKDSADVYAFTGLASIAFLRTKFDSCIAIVNKAEAVCGKINLKMAYFRGASYGRIGKTEDAIADLGKYAVLGGDETVKNDMALQLQFYENKLYESMAKTAFESQSTQAVSVASDSIVAVIPFKNASPGGIFNPLQTGFADMVITDLSQVQSIRIVERSKMQKLLAEIGLDLASVTQDADRARVAKFLNASRIVGGMYSCSDSIEIKIKGGFVDTKKSATVNIAPLSGELKAFFAIEKSFVFAILEKMEIKITEAEREKIQKIPTENLLAFIAYSQGLEAMDQGRFDIAKDAFNKAKQLDPKFKAAKDMANQAAMSQALSTPAAPVAEQEIPIAPVVYQTSGPSGAVLAPKAELAQPKATASSLGFAAGSALGFRTSTITQVGFMPEVAVHESQPVQETKGTAAGKNDNSGASTIYTRPAYADSHGLTLENTKGVNIVVELPVVP